MNDWMHPDSPISFTQKDAAADAPLQEQASQARALRLFDLALALIAATVLLVLFPLLLWAALTGQRNDSRRIGAQHRGFTLLRWRFPDSTSGRLLTRIGAGSWPMLINIVRGDMAWVGPRVRKMGEHTGPAVHLRPGLTGLHQLRKASSVDFMSEAVSETAYLQDRGLAHDARLLLLSAGLQLGRRSRQSAATVDKVQILDVCVDNLLMDAAVQRVTDMIASGRHAKVSFVNPACANIATAHPDYRRDLAACELVLPDGIGMKIASEWLGTPIRQNVNGTDFFPRLCNAMNEQGQRLYLLGARPQVVERVAEVVRERWPRIEVVGARHGYVQAAEEASVAHDIQESGAHVVLVAMGVPVQEGFIARQGHRMGPCVAIGVGGLFDFVAGRISRAPQWMRDAGLEWVWRLMQEPGRMWKRYLVGNFSFLARVAMQRKGWRTAQASANLEPVAAQTGPSAILLATHALDTDGTTPHLAAGLPFGPASFAEAIVAQLASQSVRHVHVLTSADGPSAQALEQQLGDGRRWGVQIQWHRPAVAEQPHQPLRAIAAAHPAGQPLLLIQAHTWLNATCQERILQDRQIVVRTAAQGNVTWQGWAHVQPADLQDISLARTEEALEDQLLDLISTRYIAMASECAGAGDRAAWLQAQTSVPAATLVALQTDVWTAHPWGYCSAHAHVSPDAHIEGPVWIGPGCVVRAEAHVGPHVTLSHNVVVEPHAMLSHAVCLPDAYIDSESSGSAGVCEATPVDLPRTATNDVNAVQVTPVPRVSRWLGAVVTALLAPIALPWLATRKLMGHGPAWVSERVVLGRPKAGARLLTTTLRQPVNSDTSAARWLAWYGALLDVAQGRRHWVGVRARRIEQWFVLEADARAALAFAPIGLWHPVAWTNRLDCVLQSEAAADRLWLVRRQPRQSVSAHVALIGLLRRSLSTGFMTYRAMDTV